MELRGLLLLLFCASAGAFIAPPAASPPPARQAQGVRILRAEPVAVEADVVFDVPQGLEDGTRRRSGAGGRTGRSRDLGGGTLFNRRADEVQEDIEKLSREIVQVVREAGARVGVRRSLQATRAVVTTAWDVMFEVGRRRRRRGDGDVAGSGPDLAGADAAKFLRVLFERLGATYIKVTSLKCRLVWLSHFGTSLAPFPLSLCLLLLYLPARPIHCIQSHLVPCSICNGVPKVFGFHRACSFLRHQSHHKERAWRGEGCQLIFVH